MYYDIKACGERIRQLRTKSGLTQESVAEALNVDRSFYSRIEAGKKGASVDMFIRLSELLHTSLDYLILGRYVTRQAESDDAAQLKKDITELAAHLERFKKSI